MKPLVSPLQQAMNTELDLGRTVLVNPVPTTSYPGSLIVGTCGACGGPMLIPEYWAGTPEVHPKPSCADCGKSKKDVARWGPVIQVE